MELPIELLGVTQPQALRFYYERLGDVCKQTVEYEELLYAASILAHFSLTSTVADGDMPTPYTLSDTFDYFVFDTSMANDHSMLETAGAQCLFLVGFFPHQLKGRHNLRWYMKLGISFFSRASLSAENPHKAEVLNAFAGHFNPWRRRYWRLSQEFRDSPYLLNLPKPLSPS